MSIQYTTNLTGQPIVEFNCPKCNLRLTASLTEAGTVEKCGECGGGFKVPGEERLEVYRAEQLQKKKLDFPLGTVVCFSVVMVGVYLLASLVVLPRTADPDFNFVDERGSVTALSAILLAAGSAFSFAAFVLSVGDSSRSRLFWIIATAALGVLALDELLQFHERIGNRIEAWGLNVGPFRNWNDIIVILYGVLGLGFVATFFSVILRFPQFLKLLTVAFVFFILHTVVDSVTEPQTTFSVIVEESAKLYCSTFLAIAFLAGMMNYAASGIQHSD